VNGVSNITDKILDEARAWSQAQLTEAEQAAADIAGDYADQATAQTKAALADAEQKAKAIQDRAVSQADMDRRKSVLSAKQETVGAAFDAALRSLAAKSEEERALLMVRMVLRYQSADAELIFNAADQKVVGPAVTEAVNSIYKKQQLQKTFSGSFLEQVKKLVLEQPSKLGVKMSSTVGGFSGGVILKEGDIENNCTFEVLLGAIRDELEGEVSSILFQ